MAGPYDLVIIGTGPGGYVCAIRAAQLGMKVAVVEKRSTHGGTCLNVGCIPSKAMLHASELYEQAGNGFAGMGINCKPQLDLAKMLEFKAEGVSGNTQGVAYLLKKNKVDGYHGSGSIVAPGRVKVASQAGDVQELATKSIVIASGSTVAPLPGVDIDEKTILSSTGALDLQKVPAKMVVVGGGVIGLELGSVWRRLGAEVVVVEFLDRILPEMDADVARSMKRILSKQGMTFKLGSKVTGAKANGSGVSLSLEPARGGDTETLNADAVLVSIGRLPFSDGLGLDELGVTLDNRKRIVVDEHYKTTVDGIYAIGDVIAGPMLAHKAEEEGVALAEILAGQAGHVNYGAIPSVIYTSPEVASVGKTEEELKAAGISYHTGKFPFTANGRAKVNHTTEGFVKILADAASDRILGVHMIGANASEMIAEAVVIMEFGGSAEDLARTCHAHPTLSEAVKEAALSVEKRALHM